MAAHELTHTLGAVLHGSPNASGAGGCLDDYDLLCGRTAPAAGAHVCPKKHENRLDCGHDDYFSTNPKPGSYLAENWNVAQSEFLLRSDGGDDIPTRPGAPEPTTAPKLGPGRADPTVTAEPNPTVTDPGEADVRRDAPPSPGVTPTDPLPTEESGRRADRAGRDARTPTCGPCRWRRRPPAAACRPNARPGRSGARRWSRCATRTSGSVRLTWSAGVAPGDLRGLGRTAADRHHQGHPGPADRLKPDATYQVTIKSGRRYTARATAETAPAARPRRTPGSP
jgi:hypothetical protein